MYWVGDTIGTVLAVYSYEYLFKQNTTTTTTVADEKNNTVPVKNQQDVENINSNGNVLELQQNANEYVVQNKMAY